MTFCFAAPVDEAHAREARAWIEALGHPDPPRDRVLVEAGIRIGSSDLQRTRDGRLLVIGFEAPRPEDVFPVLERSSEPWTRTLWTFLQHAEPFHPAPPSPLDLLLEDAAPAWQSLRDDLKR